MTCGAAPGSPPSRASRTRKLDRSVRPQAPGSGVVRARGLLEPLRLFAVAVGFLTRVPVPQTDIRVDDLRRASAFFPLVGLGVAGVGVAVRAAFEPIWGSGVATLAAIAAMILVTGAFHEDGLADTADGLWGGWDPAARLAIMRDSRIGTYGAVALIIVIALRAGLLLPLGLADFTRAVICGHVLARASTLLLARILRPAGGPGSVGGGPLPAGDPPPPVTPSPRVPLPPRVWMGRRSWAGGGGWGFRWWGRSARRALGWRRRWWRRRLGWRREHGRQFRWRRVWSSVLAVRGCSGGAWEASPVMRSGRPTRWWSSPLSPPSSRWQGRDCCEDGRPGACPARPAAPRRSCRGRSPLLRRGQGVRSRTGGSRPRAGGRGSAAPQPRVRPGRGIARPPGPRDGRGLGPAGRARRATGRAVVRRMGGATLERSVAPGPGRGAGGPARLRGLHATRRRALRRRGGSCPGGAARSHGGARPPGACRDPRRTTATGRRRRPRPLTGRRAHPRSRLRSRGRARTPRRSLGPRRPELLTLEPRVGLWPVRIPPVQRIRRAISLTTTRRPGSLRASRGKKGRSAPGRLDRRGRRRRRNPR